MATILSSKSYYLNDVNLLPKRGVVESRKEVDIELYRTIVSPMTSIVGRTFVEEAAKQGLSLCVPRFLDLRQKIDLYQCFENNRINDKQLCFLAVGLKEELDSKIMIKRMNIVVDIASGYVKNLYPKIYSMLKNVTIENLMVGNIVSLEGIRCLYSLSNLCNKLLIRVGIGNGTPCKTSDETGINRGTITELIECYDYLGKIECLNKIQLVSDGGITKSGFAMKAFGAGANYVLIGGMFAKAKEAENIITNKYEYFGCASDRQNYLAGLDKHSEGKEITLINKLEVKPLKEIIKQYSGALSSGISYVGYKSLSGFIGNGVFEAKYNSLPPKVRY